MVSGKNGISRCCAATKLNKLEKRYLLLSFGWLNFKKIWVSDIHTKIQPYVYIWDICCLFLQRWQCCRTGYILGSLPAFTRSLKKWCFPLILQHFCVHIPTLILISSSYLTFRVIIQLFPFDFPFFSLISVHFSIFYLSNGFGWHEIFLNGQ
jgi:hypothetical protein